jgi:hypothetical protein
MSVVTDSALIFLQDAFALAGDSFVIGATTHSGIFSDTQDDGDLDDNGRGATNKRIVEVVTNATIVDGTEITYKSKTWKCVSYRVDEGGTRALMVEVRS